MRLDKEKQWVRLSWRGSHTPVEKVLPSSPSARSVTQENRPWPWTLPHRGKEAAQPGPLLPRAGMDVPASGSPGAPLLCSSGCLDGPDGLQRSVAHTPQGRGVSFCRSTWAPRAGHLSRVRRVGPAGRGDQHTPSIGARLPPSPLCAVPSSARPRRAELWCPPPARALPWH